MSKKAAGCTLLILREEVPMQRADVQITAGMKECAGNDAAGSLAQNPEQHRRKRDRQPLRLVIDQVMTEAEQERRQRNRAERRQHVAQPGLEIAAKEEILANRDHDELRGRRPAE